MLKTFLFATLMSALPPKADIFDRHEKGLLLTESGHSEAFSNLQF
jgi:hypothetical protein